MKKVICFVLVLSLLSLLSIVSLAGGPWADPGTDANVPVLLHGITGTIE